jgi:hypothetical protein
MQGAFDWTVGGQAGQGVGHPQGGAPTRLVAAARASSFCKNVFFLCTRICIWYPASVLGAYAGRGTPCLQKGRHRGVPLQGRSYGATIRLGRESAKRWMALGEGDGVAISGVGGHRGPPLGVRVLRVDGRVRRIVEDVLPQTAERRFAGDDVFVVVALPQSTGEMRGAVGVGSAAIVGRHGGRGEGGGLGRPGGSPLRGR